MFSFDAILGILIGIAIRTGSPLSLSLAEPVWKQLAGMPLTVTDLTEVDKDYMPGRLLLSYCCLSGHLHVQYVVLKRSLFVCQQDKQSYVSLRCPPLSDLHKCHGVTADSGLSGNVNNSMC